MKKIFFLLLLLLIGSFSYAQNVKSKRIIYKIADSTELEKLRNFDKDFIQLKKLSFNTGKSEYAPTFYANGIIFSKSKSNLIEFKNRKSARRLHKSKLYFSSLDLDYSNATPLKVESKNILSTTQANFYNPQKTVYYTALGNANGKVISKKQFDENSFRNNQIENELSNFNSFSNNGSFYSIETPCLNSAGDKLYFSSNMNDGYGGMDIYVSEWINNEWAEPVNLGPSVNSKGDELYPFVLDDSLLYFASNGRFGLGGLDVFLYNTKAEKTINVGAPINSEYDDFGLIRLSKINNGYFSSNRAENGKNYDIYSYKSIRPKAQEIEINIIDASTGKTVDNVKLNSSSNLTKAIDYYKLLDGKLTGMKFEIGIPYKFYIKKYGYFNKETSIVFKKTDKQISLYIEKDPSIDTSTLEEEEKWVMAENYTFKAKIKSYIKQIFNTSYKAEDSGDGKTIGGYDNLNTIYFDFNKSNLKPESIEILDKIALVLKEQKALNVTVISYTDSRGAKDYNLKLSVKRANATSRYLTKKGVKKSRIKSIGKGELNPIVKCSKNCTEKDYAMNRRTEIIIK